MEFENGERPIIVRKVKKVVKGGHHGGAWKVAFADFAVAMMAFFLVLWLLEASSEEEKKAISGYFSDPTAFTDGGSPYIIDLEGSLMDTDSSDDGGKQETAEEEEQRHIVLDEEAVQDLAQQIEMKKFQELKTTLEAKIEENPDLEKFKDQILIEITEDGLHIQIIDKDSRPMFNSGSSRIKRHTVVILKELAATIGTLENKISVSGHTDAAAFTERDDYSNWELSAERANSARRALVSGGIIGNKVAQVSGLASSVLFDQDNPLNPTNRRIAILVLSERAAQRITRQQQRPSDKKKKIKKALPEDSEFDAGYIESLDIDVEAEANLKQQQKANKKRSPAFEHIRKTLDQRSKTSRKKVEMEEDGEFF